MGNCQSDPDEKINKRVENEIKNHRAEEATKMKILLLGAGESGKSTIFKQMQLLHCSGYDESARLQFRANVYGNCIDNAKALVRGTNSLGGTKLEFPELDEIKDSIGVAVDPNLKRVLREVWEHPEIQKGYENRSRFHLNDSQTTSLRRRTWSG